MNVFHRCYRPPSSSKYSRWEFAEANILALINWTQSIVFTSLGLIKCLYASVKIPHINSSFCPAYSSISGRAIINEAEEPVLSNEIKIRLPLFGDEWITIHRMVWLAWWWCMKLLLSEEKNFKKNFVISDQTTFIHKDILLLSCCKIRTYVNVCIWPDRV